MDVRSLIILGALCLVFAIATGVVRSILSMARTALLVVAVAAFAGAVLMAVRPG